MDDSVITCDHIIDANAESKSYDKASSYNEKTKSISTNFDEEQK